LQLTAYINKNNKKNILIISQNKHEIVRNSMQEMMEFYKSKNYFAAYDKRKRLIVIRSRIATMGTDNQVICFGAGLGLSKLALERWAGQILKRLDQGSTEDEANVWIHAKMNEFRF
jgi:hypothetical protein